MACESEVRRANRFRSPQAKILENLDFKNPPDAILQYRFLLKDDFDPVKLSNFLQDSSRIIEFFNFPAGQKVFCIN